MLATGIMITENEVVDMVISKLHIIIYILEKGDNFKGKCKRR